MRKQLLEEFQEVHTDSPRKHLEAYLAKSSEPEGILREIEMADGMQQDRAIYVISVAAELAGVHPQTLRIYERKGLLRPQRTAGNTRRYSERDIALLPTDPRADQRGRQPRGSDAEFSSSNKSSMRLRVLVHLDAVVELESAIDDLQHLVEQRDSTALVPLREVRSADACSRLTSSSRRADALLSLPPCPQPG